MKPTNLEIGGVYQTEWDKRPYRIIGLDETEVFYDCLINDQSWMFSGNRKKKCYFYRTSTSLFETKSTKVDHIPMNAEEQLFFRPDLVMRIGRTGQLNWNQMNFASPDELDHYINAASLDELTDQRIETDSIIVYPYGPAGGLKKGEKLIAANSTFFSAAELIWKCTEIQQAVNSNSEDGIGLYRIGTEKGLPSYYIGSYFDNAGLLKD